ncbi:DUF6585 family protein [Kitasatospora kifunensis]|uniref:Uncharacterized protein n=1 Tax=Kitasatospora kifunensis TaxID=58351 RepID=A0A7W7VW60_KITKI|nr:DUF6585 family protein [Kitasatospora kifunensis]MBB4924225.1 hypothetical protein [Kitasatospora kifunensis]
MAGDVDALIAQAGLGGLRGSFWPTRHLRWEERTTGDKVARVIMAVIPLGLLGLILVALISTVPVFGLILLAIVLGIFGLRLSQAKSRKRGNEGRELRIYERGVALLGTGGATVKAYRWDDMSVLQNITRHHRNGGYTHTTYAYTLSAPGVETTRVNGGVIGTFQDPDTWGPEIQQRVTAAQLPPALDAVRAGRTVEFGPFSVSAERLTAGGKSAAWSEIQEIKIERGYLSVKQQGRWLSLSFEAVSRIPNFFVFRTLADRLVEAAAGGAR